MSAAFCKQGDGTFIDSSRGKVQIQLDACSVKQKINARDKLRQHLSRILHQQQPQNKGQSRLGASLVDKDPDCRGQSNPDMDNLVRRLLTRAKDELWERFKHFRRFVRVLRAATSVLLVVIHPRTECCLDLAQGCMRPTCLLESVPQANQRRVFSRDGR